MESMSSLRFNKIIFGLEAKDLISAITRPPAWPCFKWLVSPILNAISLLSDWKLLHVKRSANKGAFWIAVTVIN